MTSIQFDSCSKNRLKATITTPLLQHNKLFITILRDLRIKTKEHQREGNAKKIKYLYYRHEYFKPVRAPKTPVLLRRSNVELPAHPLKPGLIPRSISILSLSDGPNFGGFLSAPSPRRSKESARSRLIAHLNSDRRS